MVLVIISYEDHFCAAAADATLLHCRRLTIALQHVDHDSDVGLWVVCCGAAPTDEWHMQLFICNTLSDKSITSGATTEATYCHDAAASVQTLLLCRAVQFSLGR